MNVRILRNGKTWLNYFDNDGFNVSMPDCHDLANFGSRKTNKKRRVYFFPFCFWSYIVVRMYRSAVKVSGMRMEWMFDCSSMVVISEDGWTWMQWEFQKYQSKVHMELQVLKEFGWFTFLKNGNKRNNCTENVDFFAQLWTTSRQLWGLQLSTPGKKKNAIRPNAANFTEDESSRLRENETSVKLVMHIARHIWSGLELNCWRKGKELHCWEVVAFDCPEEHNE